MRTVPTWALLSLLGVTLGPGAVGCGRGPGVDAGRDVPSVDAPSFDAPGLDAPSDVPSSSDVPADVPRDVRGLDTPRDVPSEVGRSDVGLDGALDTGTDTGRDSGIDTGRDTGSDAGSGSGRLIECAPPVGTASAGLVCSAMFWPGFQFQITADAHLIGVGVQGSADGSVPASVHATVYRISGPGVAPVLADASAVMARTLVTLPSGTPLIGTASVDAVLSPGWYALVVGTGAHGATAISASLPSGGATGCFSTPGSGYPFTVRLSDGMYILQGASPHLFVAFE